MGLWSSQMMIGVPDHMGYLLLAIVDERRRQEALKREGRFTHSCADEDMPDHEALAVLIEEVGEAARAMLESGRGISRANDAHGASLRQELIQVAAVALAWLEKLESEGRDE